MSNRISDPKYLRAYYPLSKDADDYSGHGNHASPAGSFVEGPFEKNVNYLSGSQTVSRNSLNFLSKEKSYTVSLFCIPITLTSSAVLYINRSNSNDRSIIGIHNTGIWVGHWTGSGYFNKGAVVRIKSVNHVTLVHTSQNSNLMYLNGKNVSTVFGATTGGTNGLLRIGYDNTTSGDSQIWNFRAYNVPLTAQEVLTLYRRGG